MGAQGAWPAEGGWAGTRLRPAPRPGGRWRGPGRVLGQRFRLRFRPRGAGRTRGAPAEAAANHRRTGTPSRQSRPGSVAPPRRVLCSLLPWRTSARLPWPGPARGLQPCDFGPARTGWCARDRVLGVSTRVCRARPRPSQGTWARRQAQACPWSCTFEGPQLPQGPRRAWPKPPKSSFERLDFDLGRGRGLRVSTRTGQWSSPGPTFPSWAAVFLPPSGFLVFAHAPSLPVALQIPSPNEPVVFLPDVPWELHPL